MKVACMFGHSCMPDPDPTERYPVFVCRRCAKRKEMSGRALNTTMVRGRPRTRR